MKNAKSSDGKGSSHKGPSSAPGVASGSRKSRWESTDNPPAPSDLKRSKPKDDPVGPSSASPSLPPKEHPSAPLPSSVSGPLGPSPTVGPPFPHPDPTSAPPPAPPPYGFHNLECRTIVPPPFAPELPIQKQPRQMHTHLRRQGRSPRCPNSHRRRIPGPRNTWCEEGLQP